MRKVLEEVVADVLRLLPRDVPEFNKIANFEFRPQIQKEKRKAK